MSYTLIPAYGRDYKSAQEVLDALNAGKDFQIAGGPYCSCRDFEGQEVGVRYARKARKIVVRVLDGRAVPA